MHIVAEDILRNPDRDLVIVIAADDICQTCRHLRADGRCDDTMNRGSDVISKQAYNDDLDRRLWIHLELDRGNRDTVRKYYRRVREHMDGIEAGCTHPREDVMHRRRGLIEDLNKLDVER